jgi:NADH:ubiquinone oxidoreductase subunit C
MAVSACRTEMVLERGRSGPLLTARWARSFSRGEHGEIVLTVARDKIVEALTILRDAEWYQQLMEMAGVDYPIASSASRWSTCCSR